uniref:Uncharacterized protein n=1 Tax=Tanacetum cinerariifolium TaxID=118510 RepID=A0A6L2NHH6_TANCI|nr:hypothetical protein [Tanacetum cinerariifolium]
MFWSTQSRSPFGFHEIAILQVLTSANHSESSWACHTTQWQNSINVLLKGRELRNESLRVQNEVNVNEVVLLNPTVQLTVSFVVPWETNGESVLKEACQTRTSAL